MLAPAENKWVPVAVRVPPDSAAQAGPGAHKIVIRVTSLGEDAASARRKDDLRGAAMSNARP
jgi:hypothetical protein